MGLVWVCLVVSVWVSLGDCSLDDYSNSLDVSSMSWVFGRRSGWLDELGRGVCDVCDGSWMNWVEVSAVVWMIIVSTITR